MSMEDQPRTLRQVADHWQGEAITWERAWKLQHDRADNLQKIVARHGLDCEFKKKLESAELQAGELRRVAEDAMAAYRQECHERGKNPNEPLEGRFQKIVRGYTDVRDCPVCCGDPDPKTEHTCSLKDTDSRDCEHDWIQAATRPFGEAHEVCLKCDTFRY